MLTISKKKLNWKWNGKYFFFFLFSLVLFPLSAFASPLTHLTSAQLNQLHIVSHTHSPFFNNFFDWEKYFFCTHLNQCQKNVVSIVMVLRVFCWWYWINQAWRGIFASSCSNNNTSAERCCWSIHRHELTSTCNTNTKYY